MNLPPDHKLQLIVPILKKPSYVRTDSDLAQLVPLIRSIQFFIERDIKAADFPEIVSCLTHEAYDQGEEVFDYNSFGDKFYVILSGKVGVQVPTAGYKGWKREEKRMEKDECKGGQQTANNRLKDRLMVQFRELREKAGKGKRTDVELLDLDTVFRYTQPGVKEEEKVESSRSLRKSTRLASVRKSPPKTVVSVTDAPLLIQVAVLGSGKAFGELALINNKPRAAKIVCLEECHFAVMSKSDYEKVLQKIEQKSINKFIDFLHPLPFFRTFTRTALGKLQYSFETLILTRNQCLYEEG